MHHLAYRVELLLACGGGESASESGESFIRCVLSGVLVPGSVCECDVM